MLACAACRHELKFSFSDHSYLMAGSVRPAACPWDLPFCICVVLTCSCYLCSAHFPMLFALCSLVRCACVLLVCLCCLCCARLLVLFALCSLVCAVCILVLLHGDQFVCAICSVLTYSCCLPCARLFVLFALCSLAAVCLVLSCSHCIVSYIYIGDK